MKKNANILKFAELDVLKDGMLFYKTTFFKIIKILFYVISVYCLLVSMAMIFASVIVMDDYSSKETVDAVARFNEANMQLWSMVISVVSIVICVVFMRLKLALATTAMSSINFIISFIVFYGPSVKNDIINGGQFLFWGTFGVPSVALALFGISVGVMLMIDNRKLAVRYNRYIKSIYNTYSNNGESTIDNERFEKLLNDYNGEELFRTDIPLKKSLRARKKKQEEKSL